MEAASKRPPGMHPPLFPGGDMFGRPPGAPGMRPAANPPGFPPHLSEQDRRLLSGAPPPPRHSYPPGTKKG